MQASSVVNEEGHPIRGYGHGYRHGQWLPTTLSGYLQRAQAFRLQYEGNPNAKFKGIGGSQVAVCYTIGENVARDMRKHVIISSSALEDISHFISRAMGSLPASSSGPAQASPITTPSVQSIGFPIAFLFDERVQTSSHKIS